MASSRFETKRHHPTLKWWPQLAIHEGVQPNPILGHRASFENTTSVVTPIRRDTIGTCRVYIGALCI